SRVQIPPPLLKRKRRALGRLFFFGSSGISGKRGRKKRIERTIAENRTNDSRWIVRQAVRAGCYAHDDADTARHSGHDTTKTKALIFIGALSVVSCFVRVVMSVDPRHVGTASEPPFFLLDGGRRPEGHSR